MIDATEIQETLKTVPSSFELESVVVKKTTKTIQMVISKLETETNDRVYDTLEEYVRDYNLLSYLYWSIGNDKHAQEYNAKALQLDASNLTAVVNKTWFNLKLNAPSKYLACYNQFSAVRNETIYNVLCISAEAEVAYCYTRLGFRQYDKAVTAFQNILGKVKEVPSIDQNLLSLWKFGLALTYRRLSHTGNVGDESQAAAADDHLKSAVKLSVEIVESDWKSKRCKALTYVQLADAFYNIKIVKKDLQKYFPESYWKWNEEDFYKLAEKNCPDEPYILERYGKYLRSQKRLEESEAKLRRSISVRPTSTAHHHLALTLKSNILKRLNLPPFSRKSFERSLSSPASRQQQSHRQHYKKQFSETQQSGSHIRRLFDDKEKEYGSALAEHHNIDQRRGAKEMVTVGSFDSSVDPISSVKSSLLEERPDRKGTEQEENLQKSLGNQSHDSGIYSMADTSTGSRLEAVGRTGETRLDNQTESTGFQKNVVQQVEQDIPVGGTLSTSPDRIFLGDAKNIQGHSLTPAKISSKESDFTSQSELGRYGKSQAENLQMSPESRGHDSGIYSMADTSTGSRLEAVGGTGETRIDDHTESTRLQKNVVQQVGQEISAVDTDISLNSLSLGNDKNVQEQSLHPAEISSKELVFKSQSKPGRYDKLETTNIMSGSLGREDATSRTTRSYRNQIKSPVKVPVLPENESKKIIEHLDKAIELGDNRAAKYDKGLILRSVKDFDGAISVFKTLMDEETSLMYLANAYEQCAFCLGDKLQATKVDLETKENMLADQKHFLLQAIIISAKLAAGIPNVNEVWASGTTLKEILLGEGKTKENLKNLAMLSERLKENRLAIVYYEEILHMDDSEERNPKLLMKIAENQMYDKNFTAAVLFFEMVSLLPDGSKCIDQTLYKQALIEAGFQCVKSEHDKQLSSQHMKSVLNPYKWSRGRTKKETSDPNTDKKQEEDAYDILVLCSEYSADGIPKIPLEIEKILKTDCLLNTTVNLRDIALGQPKLTAFYSVIEKSNNVAVYLNKSYEKDNILNLCIEFILSKKINMVLILEDESIELSNLLATVKTRIVCEQCDRTEEQWLIWMKKLIYKLSGIPESGGGTRGEGTGDVALLP